MDYIELIEEGKLFVLCRETTHDDEGTYCLKGSEYEVIDITDDEECFIISTEDDDMEMQIKINDSDFEIIIKED